jgi:O-antigen ligase
MSIWLIFSKKANLLSFGVLKNPLLLIVLFYCFSTLIAWSMSRVPQEGYMDIVRISLFLGLIAIGALAFDKKVNWQEILPIMVSIAALMALYVGFKQYIVEVLQNTSQTLEDGRATIYKVEGLMSHKNEYSNALMLMVPFLAFGLYRLEKGWRLFVGLMLVGVLAMIFILKTRAVWVGLMGALYGMALLGTIFHKKLEIPQVLRNIVLAILVLIGIAVLFIFNMNKPSDDFSFLGRIYSLIDLESYHNVHRLRIWKATWQMILDKPWFGWGPGNWNLEFMPYIAGLFDEIEQTNWERPHNDFLWVFAEKGVFGISSFLTFFAYLGFLVVRVIQKGENNSDKILALLIFGGLISYLAISFFSFPLERINHQVYLSLFAVTVLSLYMKSNRTEQKVSHLKWLFAPSILVFSFAAYYGNRAIIQEQHILKANIAFEKKNYNECIRQAELSRNPYRIITNGMRPTDDYIALAYERLNEPTKALEAINKALEIYPNNIVMHNRKGLYLYLLKDYKQAKQYALSALEVLPRSKKTLYDLTACYVQLGEMNKAYETIMKIPMPNKYPDVMKARKELSRYAPASLSNDFK